MKGFFRLVACVAAACVLAVMALAVWSWAWPAGPDPGLLELPDLLWQVGEATRLDEALSRQQVRLARVRAERLAVTEALVEGRLSLREAVAHFRASNEANPDLAEATRRGYPSASDDEAACRQVLAWAKMYVGDLPAAKRRAVMARLEEEARPLLTGQ
jgi:hypothetical protein